MTKDHTKISKFLSYVLRHKPEAIGLTLNTQGWASIDELIGKADIPLTRQLLLDVVTASDKQRFAISDDGQRIRANQGHSVDIDLNLPPAEPPETLFHGTAERFVASIRTEGLKPGARQHVHLSRDTQTATAVGQRYGKPVILKIEAALMHERGHVFYLADNGVWLTAHVPTDFIRWELV